MAKSDKYSIKKLIPMFRHAAKFRNELVKNGFTDNAGAIHSAERILNILGKRLNYPNLGHPNKYKNYRPAEFSLAAWKAYQREEKVQIEHVSPIRDFTRKAIKRIGSISNDSEFTRVLISYVKKHYRLVLLTPDETTRLNRMNRSKMVAGRLKKANIRTLIVRK